MNFVWLVENHESSNKRLLVFGDDNPVMLIPAGITVYEYLNENFQGMGQLMEMEHACVKFRQVGHTTLLVLDMLDKTHKILFELTVEAAAEAGSVMWTSQFHKIVNEPIELHPQVDELIQNLFSNLFKVDDDNDNKQHQ